MRTRKNNVRNLGWVRLYMWKMGGVVDGKVGKNRSPGEIVTAVQYLSNAEVAKLANTARSLALKCRAEPKELLNEALLRALDGRRKTCPTTLPIINFLFGVMKSVADEWLDDGLKRTGEGVVPVSTGEEEGTIDPPSSGLTPEKALEDVQVRQHAAVVMREVREMFENDKEAWFVIEADLDGEMIADEVCEVLGVDRKRYNAIRKRIRRGYAEIRAKWKGLPS